MFGCFNITHVSLLILQQFCPNIETLNVGQCHKVISYSIFLMCTNSVLYIFLISLVMIKRSGEGLILSKPFSFVD